MTDKRPCPFCGYEYSIVKKDYDTFASDYVVCIRCSGRANVDDWNNRDPDPAVAKLAKVKALIDGCVERNRMAYDDADEHFTIGDVYELLRDEKQAAGPSTPRLERIREIIDNYWGRDGYGTGQSPRVALAEIRETIKDSTP